MEEKIYEYLRMIPKGKVVTYGQIAEYLGNRYLARHVGNVIHKNPDPIGTPCYKVVNSMGKLARHYGDGGIEVQKKRLEDDGIEVDNYTIDLAKYRFG